MLEGGEKATVPAERKMLPPGDTCNIEDGRAAGSWTVPAAEIVMLLTLPLSSMLPVPFVVVNRLPTLTLPVAACKVTESILV